MSGDSLQILELEIGTGVFVLFLLMITLANIFDELRKIRQEIKRHAWAIVHRDCIRTFPPDNG